MTEKKALLLAGAAHLLLLAALSVSLSRHLPPSLDDDAIPVEFVEIGPQPTTPEPPKPSMEAAPQEPGPPPPAPLVEPAPAPEPPAPAAPQPEPVKAEDTAPQDAVAEQVKKPPKQEKAKPAPAKPPAKAAQKAPDRPDFDTGAMAALIDKSLPKASVKPRDTSAFAKSIEQAIPRGAKISPRQVATLEQAIRSQIAPCWNPPIGGADVTQMTAVLRIRLNRDGTVFGNPEFVSQTGATVGNQAYARAFVETARRAVLRCAPLELPADLYSYWREFELNFDPRLMT